MSSAVGETAHSYGYGAIVNLDRVPLKEKSLAPWEIYISESQERMLLSVNPQNLERVLTIFRSEEVEATPIGRYTSDNLLVLNFYDKKIAEVSIPFLFKPPTATKIATYSPIIHQNPIFSEPKNLGETLLQLQYHLPV